MTGEAKAEKAAIPTAKFEVIRPVRHKGKDYEPSAGIMLTEDEALHLVRDGIVRVPPRTK